MQIIFNGEPRIVAPGTTIAALLCELSLLPQHVGVEVNLDLVPRSQHAERMLAEGDHLEVVTFVGGG